MATSIIKSILHGSMEIVNDTKTYKASTTNYEQITTKNIPPKSIFLLWFFSQYSSGVPNGVMVTAYPSTDAWNRVGEGSGSSCCVCGYNEQNSDLTLYFYAKRASVPGSENAHRIRGAIITP